MSRRDEIVRLVARMAAQQWGVPPERVAALESNVLAAVNGELSRMFGGGRLELTTCRVPHEARTARNARILDALARGESAASVARREGVSPRMVRWLRRQRVRVEIAAHAAHDGSCR